MPATSRRAALTPRPVGGGRDEAVKMAESLLSSYVVRVLSGSEDAFQENYTYGIIREYVTMQSFQGLITRKVRACMYMCG